MSVGTRQRNKAGTLSLKKKHSWKLYTFKVTSSTYFHYFDKKDANKAKGQILLHQVGKVEVLNTASGPGYPFAVHFSDKSSPWLLSAASEVDRASWIEAIKPGALAQQRSTLERYKSTEESPALTSTSRPQLLRFLSKPASTENPKSPMSTPVEPSLQLCSPTLPMQPSTGGQVVGPPPSPHLSMPSTGGQGAGPPPSPLPSLLGTSPKAHLHMDPSHFAAYPDDYTSPLESFSWSQEVENNLPPPLLPTRTLRGADPREVLPSPPVPARKSPTPLHAPLGQKRVISSSCSDSYIVQGPSDLTHKTLLPDFTQKGQAPDFTQKGQAPDFTQKGQAPDFTQKGQAPDFTQKGQAPDFTQKGQAPDFTQKGQAPDFTQKGQAPDFTQKGQAPDFTQKGQAPDFTQKGQAPDFKGYTLLSDLTLSETSPEEQVPTSGSMAVGGRNGATLTMGGINEVRRDDLADQVRKLPPEQLEKLLAMMKGAINPEAMLGQEDEEMSTEEPASMFDSSTELDSLTDLRTQTFCISSSALSDLVPIGHGQFGKVFRATLHKGTPGEVLVAVKTTKTNSTENDRADFMKEMMVMSRLLHPNIVRFYGVVHEAVDSYLIVLEYLTFGDLRSYLVKTTPSRKQLVKYMIDVAMGMHYISEKGLVHRDLAARNVLVGENEVCKVADFGLLRELPEDGDIYYSMHNIPCPIKWMPPESINGGKFSVASDVWSFGVLMWEMFNPSKTPYQGMNNMECAVAVCKGHRLPMPRGIPDIMAKIMESCWSQNPMRRPNFLLILTLLTTKALPQVS